MIIVTILNTYTEAGEAIYEVFEVDEDKLLALVKQEESTATAITLDENGGLTVFFGPDNWHYYVPRIEGSGINNSFIGDIPGGFEYCGSGRFD